MTFHLLATALSATKGIGPFKPTNDSTAQFQQLADAGRRTRNVKKGTQPKRPESARACWPRDRGRAVGDSSPSSAGPGPLELPFQPFSSFCHKGLGTSDKRIEVPSKAKAQNVREEGQWKTRSHFHLRGRSPPSPPPCDDQEKKSPEMPARTHHCSRLKVQPQSLGAFPLATSRSTASQAPTGSEIVDKETTTAGPEWGVMKYLVFRKGSVA